MRNFIDATPGSAAWERHINEYRPSAETGGICN
jgi:hypothetical protein